MPANLENSAVATGLEKVSFYSNPKERQCQRMLSYHTIAFISHASEEMLKILQARLQQHLNCELPDVPAGFRKARETRDQIANIHWIIGKSREFQKKSTSALLIMPKAFTVYLTKQLENSERDGDTSPPYLPPVKPVCRSRSNS